MRKAVFGMLVVLALTFGSVPIGESATLNYTGCINRIQHRLDRTNGRASLSVRVGNKSLNFQTGKMSKIKIGGVLIWLTPSQLAAREPLLRQFRAGAVARVKARFWYDGSTKALKEFWILFNTPCK